MIVFQGMEKKKCFGSRINRIWFSLNVGVRERGKYTIIPIFVFIGWAVADCRLKESGYVRKKTGDIGLGRNNKDS